MSKRFSLRPMISLVVDVPAVWRAPRCSVCASENIATDEVLDRDVLRLAECRRCQHRWTESIRPCPVTPLVASARGSSEAAAA